MTAKTAPKQPAAKPAAPKAAPKTKTLGVWVEQWNQSIAKESKQAGFIAQQREILNQQRAVSARIAYRVYNTPEGGRKLATTAKLLGVARNTLRPYIEGAEFVGAKRMLGRAKLNAKDVEAVADAWDSAAAKRRRDNLTNGKTGNGGNGKGPDGENTKSGNPALKPADKVKVADVHNGIDAALMAARAWTKGHGFSTAEHDALASKLAELSALIESNTAKK